MPAKLTNNDLIAAASRLGCEVAAIRAVDEVESNGNGFDSAGRPTIRFETAWFRTYTGVTVSGSSRDSFNKAFAINPTAAMTSTSWGRYQVMGFNYKLVGYSSVNEFVDAMRESEQKHLAAFLTFVEKKSLVTAIRTRSWAAFAYKYNGANYAEGKYHIKLATAYAKYSKEVILPEALNDPVVIKKKVLSTELIIGIILLLVFGAGYYLYFSGRSTDVLRYIRLRTSGLFRRQQLA
ncbi:N-acetylmuramidase family protein [Fibrella forsythiae]|uniref:N-acetylmuramidase family protein n=1 Tax=Fibrella forsythiae TaxID=2817061 RepID=A0ABS3JMH0_9BACT|nr:N-acetylmuramidase family protein [Fibrella forsythiae]MBO0951204.1 N-acetylmuramidase family protein [Fibrella forsythiae]